MAKLKGIGLSVMMVLFFILINYTCFAQGDPGCDPLDPTCPIDGGVSLLIAAGVGMVARNAYKAGKHKKAGDNNL